MMKLNRRGFTLVETLVAIVILMIVIGAIYGTFRSANQSMTITEERADVNQTARILLMQINRELSSACQMPSADNPGLTGEDTEGSSSSVQRDKLTFITTAHRKLSRSEPEGDLCEVTYAVATTPDEEPLGLVVEENFLLDLRDSGVESEPVMLSKMVIGLNCRYLDGETSEWQDEWLNRDETPKAVRVEIMLKPDRKNAKPVIVASTANLHDAVSTDELNAPVEAENGR